MTDDEWDATEAGRNKLLIQANRLRRKLVERDKRIAGLEREVKRLKDELTLAHFEAKRLPGDVRRAVQEALCNVRMIPVLGIGGGSDRIVEIKASTLESRTTTEPIEVDPIAATRRAIVRAATEIGKEMS